MISRQMYALVENRPGNRMFGEPFYIGIGNAQKRYGMHLCLSRRNKHYNSHLQEVINAHLSVSVRPLVKTLCIGSSRYISELEKKAIKAYGGNRLEGGVLCNMTRGGDGPPSELMSNPVILAKVSAASKATFQRPGYREAHAARAKAAYVSQELRDRVGAATKAALAKPESRARLLAALDRIHAQRTPEQYREYAKKARDNHPERAEADRQRLIARQAAITADPVLAAKRREIRSRDAKAAWADPIMRAARLARMKGVRKDTSSPEWKAARAKAVAAMHAAKRAKKALRLQAEAIVNPTRIIDSDN
jgi:hypothetical protein